MNSSASFDSPSATPLQDQALSQPPPHLTAALWRCCAFGDGAGARLLLARGVDPNAILEQEHEAWALLNLGAHAKRGAMDGATPLIFASRMGSAHVFDALMEAGADFSARDHHGVGPLIAALKSQRIKVAERALDAFDRAGPDCALELGALTESTRWGRRPFVERLLSLGADPNESFGGSNPVTAAAEHGLTWLMTRLVHAGARIDEPRARDGATALALAARRGDRAFMEAAFALGADPDRPASGLSPLHWVVLRPDPMAIQLLAARTKNVDSICPATGLTPLGRAARGGKADSMRALLAAGANPHDVGGGLNALMATFGFREAGDYAAPSRNACMELAIAAGVDLEACDARGDWPLKNALYDFRCSNKGHAVLLLQAGSNTEHLGEDGLTLLESCALRCLKPGYSVEIEHVKPLLAYGARITEPIKAIMRDTSWKAKYRWSLDWFDDLQAAALLQDEVEELSKIAPPTLKSGPRRV